MRFCDLTYSYTETSGGIRRYIDEKRKHLLERTEHEHVLIVPGEEDSVEREERAVTYRIASPVVPGAAPYRMFIRPDKIADALEAEQPDVIELASFYVSPWAAFSFRKKQAECGRRCLVGGYFHTDIADAYVGSPLRNFLRESVGPWSETLESLGLKLADRAETSAEEHFAKIFDFCDLLMAATPPQAERVKEYGAEQVEIVPLGVDLELFHPNRRDERVRAELGVGEGEPLLIYAGRLDAEKHVETLAEAHGLLPEGLRAHLALMGEGPLREELEVAAAERERLHLLPFESDARKVAALLASADVYVTAGPHETFALSVIEAQACGLPVVGVDEGALRERVPEDLGYLVPVDDAAAMAQAIQQAWDASERLGANARRHVERNFSWERTFTRLLANYEAKRKLVEQAAPPGAAPSEWREAARAAENEG